MRSDERFYFGLAALVMTTSLVYTIFFQVLPGLDARHNYVYAHCTVTGAGHWEKYETIYGIKERVVVPVEVRIGTIEGALDWDGLDPLNSVDAYHQGIGRDKPSGWEYFTSKEKENYIQTYIPGKEYECWMRPGSGTVEVVFHKKPISFRLIPAVIFCCIVFFLCVATGVCMGMIDVGRECLRLPTREKLADDDDDDEVGSLNYGALPPSYLPAREFAPAAYYSNSYTYNNYNATARASYSSEGESSSARRVSPPAAYYANYHAAEKGSYSSGDREGDREWV